MQVFNKLQTTLSITFYNPKQNNSYEKKAVNSFVKASSKHSMLFFQLHTNILLLPIMAKQIYIKDWLTLKPYERQTITDAFYLKVCNKVKNAIVKESSISEFLDEEGLTYLSCFLTSYLEDIISETNIWTTFIRLHKNLYNKELPFYPLDQYYEDEVNIQDVSFLVWYFLNTIQEEEFKGPFNNLVVDTAYYAALVLDHAWENAPENTYLKQFYQIDNEEEDFYVARLLIDRLLFDSYLFNPDTGLKLNRKNNEIIKENKNDHYLLRYLQEHRDITIQSTHTKLLSLKGKEWIAEILGSNHPLSNDFLNISQKINGFFLYKGQDASNLFLEHIASGKKFELTKKSFDNANDLDTVDTILFMGVVRWKDEWWFSGTYIKLDYDLEIVLEEKKSLRSRSAVNFLDHSIHDTKADLKRQLAAFKKFNNGSQIAFLPSDEINSFIEDYIYFYNNSLKVTEKEKDEAFKKAQQLDLFNNKEEKRDFSEVSNSGLVFFSAKSGVEIALDINSAFPMFNNPFFDIKKSEDDVMFLMASDEFSNELAMFCIDNCKNELPFFDEDRGAYYLEDIDFLLRFWKKDSYHPSPEITYYE